MNGKLIQIFDTLPLLVQNALVVNAS